MPHTPSTRTRSNQKSEKSNHYNPDCSGKEGNKYTMTMQSAEIKDMFSEILTELKTMKKQNEEFREETREEIKSIKEELRKRDDKWEEMQEGLEVKIANADNMTQQKIMSLAEKIKALEEQEEQRTKRERKNNIIIKSKAVVFEKDAKVEMETKVREILNKIDTEVVAVNMMYIGKDRQDRGMARVTFKCFEDKIKIVKNKSILRGQDTYIDDDLTKKEREIQAVLRQRAREEREKGDNEARVGYQKILLQGQWVNWKDLQSKNGRNNTEA